jgi:alkylation response protein AidB-like acyl-CoA dehydrogenase
VARVRATLLAGTDEAEARTTLPLATVQVLDDAGLLALKLPAVLGGTEADLVTQMEVLEAVSYINTSAGWCTLIGAAAIAALGAFLAVCDGCAAAVSTGYNTAAQHLIVSDAAYENYGQCLLGLSDVAPLQ